MKRRSRAVVVAVLACSLHSRALRAQEPAASADALIEHAIGLREQGRDAEALAELERAEAIQPSPRAHAQVALAAQALGRWVRAEAGLSEALASDDAWIDRNRPALQSALATTQAHLGWLEVEVDVAGAALLVDGQPCGALPASSPVRVVAGRVVVEVRAPGYEAALRRVDLAPGARAHEAFTLVPELAPGPVVAAPRQRVDGSLAARPARGAAWATLGVAGALVTGGVVALVVRNDAASTYDDNARCLGVPGQSRDAQCGSYRTTAQVATGLAVAGFAGGALAAVASGYLFLRPTPPPSRATSARCTVGLLALSCGLSF